MSKKYDKNYSIRSFFSYLSQHKFGMAITGIGFALADVLIFLMPIYIGKLVGDLASSPIKGHAAIIDLWILIGLSFFHSILWHFSEFLYIRYINGLSYNYENMLFKAVITKPYPYFVDKFTGKISSYISTTSSELHGLTDAIFYNYINLVISIISISVILLAINWQTGIIFFAGLLVMLLVGMHTIKNSIIYEKASTDIQSTKNGKIIDAIANFINVKSFQNEEREIAGIQSEQKKTISASNRSFRWTVFFWASMSFFVRDVIWPATLGLNVYLYLHHKISLTQLTTVLSTILLFSSAIWEVIWHLSQFNLRLARIEEAHRYLFGTVNIFKLQSQEPQDKQPIPAFERNLELRDLHFAYPDKTDVKVLSHIHLNISKGEKVGVVGRSGSGKTTLTKLLLGYYPTSKGQLFLDGQAVNAKDLAKIISFVPQDTSMFHRTIADNIAYAKGGRVSLDAIKSAAKRAHADEFISKITDGYNALVGERGVKLSAGQRQRIAIARALLDDKPILILDEATSALDSESEVLVQQGLEALWEEKTVIAIAHRLSTLRHMDKIIVMDKGRIVEQGSHTELLKTGGSYSKLWNHQSGGFIEE